MKNASIRSRELGRSILLGMVFGALLAIVFFIGFFTRELIDVPPVLAVSPSNNSAVDGYPLLDEVQGLLDQHYLREQPDYITRQYGAIRGMLNAIGDRNTFFIEPAVARSESDVLAGTYGGIGVSLRRGIDGEFILSPFPDGPAADAGVSDGDVLISINGEPIALDMQQDAVDQLLRGEVDGTNGVEINVIRQDDTTRTFFIAFDVINVPSVLSRVLTDDGTIGYIQLLRFTSRTPSEIESALESLSEQGIEALILDLRRNGGGLLQEAIDVASLFLDGGVVLYEVTSSGEEVYSASAGELLAGQPIAVLINSGTASAAELVAGALQDRGRATLIGQASYGKGTIQQIFTLSDLSSIHITSAEWFTPDRNALDGVGLTPDIVIIPDENGRDLELGEAIRVLQEQITIRN